MSLIIIFSILLENPIYRCYISVISQLFVNNFCTKYFGKAIVIIIFKSLVLSKKIIVIRIINNKCES